MAMPNSITLNRKNRVHTPNGGNYDLILTQDNQGNCILTVFMKLQFFFANNGNLKWSDAEQNKFVNDWVREVKRAWEGKHTLSAPPKCCKCSSGIQVKLSFQTQIEGFMYDHWEISVTKTNRFKQSRVYMKGDMAKLDSEDLTPIEKRGGDGTTQRGAIHEFGHMMGLLDEYKTNGKLEGYDQDHDSVMNIGEEIRERHYQYLQDWINNNLDCSPSEK